jgi:hypothetical protein
MNWGDEFAAAIAALPQIVEEPIEYRIHYNEHGTITMCSMQQHPADTKYIVVTKEEYDNYFRYTIVNDKLKKIDTMPKIRVQLKKSDNGYRVVKNHAGLILEPGEAYADTEYYDRTN